jgi:hypothetical protein
MGRTAGDVEIDGNYRMNAMKDFRTPFKGTSSNSAGPHSNHNLRIGDRFVGFFEGELHVFCNGACDDEAIGVSRRGNKLNPKTGEIKDHIIQGLKFEIAAVATPCANLSEFEGSTEELLHFLIQSLRKLKFLSF